MAHLIVLLRGVNLVSRNRVSMPVLREVLVAAGYEDVRTYLQSGNVVLTTERAPTRVAKDVAKVIEERFGLEIGVVVRTRAELAKVIDRNPLGSVVTEPKRCQVTFLDGEPDPAAFDGLRAAASGGEVVEHAGREIYTWHPAGLGHSKLARLLSGKSLGVTATSRNWATVTAVLAIAVEG